MDVEKLIRAAEYCKTNGLCFDCKHDNKPECVENVNMTTECVSRTIISIRNHYETKMQGMATINQVIENARFARLEVISEVREWAEIACAHQNIYWRQGFEEAITKLDLKLDEMEERNV